MTPEDQAVAVVKNSDIINLKLFKWILGGPE